MSGVESIRRSKGGDGLTGAKRHHYVPRFYLNGFTGAKDRLFVANRPTRHSFRTAPDNVAGENYFNRIEVAGMDPNALEKALAERSRSPRKKTGRIS